MNGGYAVMFFFVVSGFLISYVLEEKYDRPSGIAEFYTARAARIYPLWWALYLIVPFVTGPGLKLFVAQIHWYDFLSGFFIFGSDYLLIFKSYPAPYTAMLPHGLELGWTLASELTFYVMAPFVLRSNTASFVVFGLSILVRIIVHLATEPDGAAWAAWGYFFFPSTALFFMLGHIGRLAYKKMPIPPGMAWVSLAFIPVLLLVDTHYGYHFDNLYFYSAICLFALALPRIFDATKDNHVSNFMGDLTYPLYLSHSVLIVLLESNGSPGSALRQSIVTNGVGMSGSFIVQALAISLPIWVLAISLAAAVHFMIELPMRAVFNTAFATAVLRARISARRYREFF